MKKEVSFYKSSVNIKPLRKLWIYFIDVICLLIISCLFFGVSELISSNLDVVKNKRNSMSVQKDQLYTLVDDSKLDVYENSSLKGSSSICKKYMYSLVLESLKYNNEEASNSSQYSGIYPISKETDNVYYYYVTYKTSNINDYSIKENYGVEYFLTLSKSNIDFDKYFEIRDNYPSLKKDIALSIHEYFNNENYTIGKSNYDTIYNYYSNMLSKGITDFTSYYSPYVNLNNEFNNGATYLLSIKIYELFASYLLSSLLLFVMFPLIFKDGKTLTFKIFHMATCKLDGNTPNITNYLLKWFINLLEYLVVISIIGIIFFNADIISLFQINLFGFFNLLTMSLFSLIIIILSIIYMFINKNKQTISEFVSMVLVKDGKEFTIVNKEEENGTRK